MTIQRKITDVFNKKEKAVYPVAVFSLPSQRRKTDSAAEIDEERNAEPKKEEKPSGERKAVLRLIAFDN